MLKLYLISQDENQSYDTYDSAVVVAESEDEARRMNPGKENGGELYIDQDCYVQSYWTNDPTKVTVVYLGKAREELKPGVICASFNAG